jgi:hypothetical protein
VRFAWFSAAWVGRAISLACTTGGPCPRPPESKRPFSAPRRTNRPDALFLSLNSNCMLSPFFSYYLTKILVLKYHLFCHPLVQLKRIYTRTLVPALCRSLHTTFVLQVAITCYRSASVLTQRAETSIPWISACSRS